MIRKQKSRQVEWLAQSKVARLGPESPLPTVTSADNCFSCPGSSVRICHPSILVLGDILPERSIYSWRQVKASCWRYSPESFLSFLCQLSSSLPTPQPPLSKYSQPCLTLPSPRPAHCNWLLRKITVWHTKSSWEGLDCICEVFFSVVNRTYDDKELSAILWYRIMEI